MNAAGRSLVLACAVALGGCSYFGWFQDADKKPMPLTEIRATVTPKVVWSASVGKSGDYRFAPKIDGNRVLAAAADGTVSILDAEAGRVVSRFDAKRRISSGAGGEGDFVAIGTPKGEVVAFDAAGKEKWVAQVGGEVLAPVTVSGKSAIVRLADGRIFAFAVADGKRQWVYQRPTPALLLRAASGVIVAPGTVVAGYPGGKLIALDIDDGKLTWEVSVSTPRGSTELERVADVAGLPVIEGTRICAAAFQGKVACFDIQTGNALWSRDISTATGLGVDDKGLYLSDDQDNVHALDRESGASRWKQDKLLRRGLTAPVVVDGKVIVGDSQGYLHVLSRDDGSFIGRLSVGDGAIRSLVAGLSGLVVQTSGGTVALVRF
ncbi:MAG: outer membrane protein assembly factor BamB [Betaproteobacteria bacterium]|nr:outer membrane protein assembly factor BamB [Betaproteobacteria bacterium]PWB60395.1 MAG: outer membrane protein assembly factor BamB [Betaproteobacteria bacterium]